MSAQLPPGGGLSDAEPISCLILPALATSASWARRQVTLALSVWAMPSESVQTAETLVSELFTNAYQAAKRLSEQPGQSDPSSCGRIGLTLRLLPGQVVIEVSDHDPSPPVIPSPDLESESGRGLAIVEALSKEWGCKSSPSGGKAVYAIIDAPTRQQGGQEWA